MNPGEIDPSLSIWLPILKFTGVIHDRGFVGPVVDKSRVIAGIESIFGETVSSIGVHERVGSITSDEHVERVEQIVGVA
jgi:hypothetical protein